jgi:hypothetical protein
MRPLGQQVTEVLPAALQAA